MSSFPSCLWMDGGHLRRSLYLPLNSCVPLCFGKTQGVSTHHHLALATLLPMTSPSLGSRVVTAPLFIRNEGSPHRGGRYFSPNQLLRDNARKERELAEATPPHLPLGFRVKLLL